MSYPTCDPQSLLPYFSKVFALIKESRQGAFERHDFEFGDDAQILGVRAYKNFAETVFRIKGSEGWEWLHADEKKGRLTLQIADEEHGLLVFRVWRSDNPEGKPQDKRMVLARNQRTPDMFGSENGTVDRWGLVYQVGDDGLAVTAFLVGYNSDNCEPLVQYEVPTDASNAGLALITKDPEAVHITPVKPKLKSGAAKPSTGAQP